ncbi:MAG: amidohydrolase, partial [Peptoniphilaceae bacterium]|nr:amidohydrolase [Peptoniphilaceae bacterium]
MEDFLIKDQIEKDKKKILDTRRKLHRMAEVSGKEFKTSKFLKEEVKKLGLAIVEVPTTGFYAVLDSGRPGKTLGLRTDIDALPICESSFNLTREKYSVSDNKEASHACGHDGHMTILLESMKILVEN